MIIYRKATIDDLKAIQDFTDWWLSGRGKAKGAAGAVNDCFISTSQHRKYILKYLTMICIEENKVIAWAVLEPSGTLIHLFVAGNCRGKGIGKNMMNRLSPKQVRSKSNQSSGNPIGFYKKLGYWKMTQVKSRSRFDIDQIKPNRKPIIDVLEIDEP